MNNVLIYRFFCTSLIKDNFREASDWLSHGKAIRSGWPFCFRQPEGAFFAESFPQPGCIKGLVRRRAREYYYFYLSSG